MTAPDHNYLKWSEARRLEQDKAGLPAWAKALRGLGASTHTDGSPVTYVAGMRVVHVLPRRWQT